MESMLHTAYIEVMIPRKVRASLGVQYSKVVLITQGFDKQKNLENLSRISLRLELGLDLIGVYYSILISIKYIYIIP